MYRVLLERGAERDLNRLSSEIHDRVITAIRALGGNPRPAGCRKLVGSKNDWRIRVGDYRVIYEIAMQTELCASTGSGTAAKFIADENNRRRHDLRGQYLGEKIHPCEPEILKRLRKNQWVSNCCGTQFWL